MSAGEARAELTAAEAANLSEDASWKSLQKKYGNQERYTAEQLRDVEENGDKPRMVDWPRPESDPVEQARLSAAAPNRTFWTGFKTPEVRQSWRDVLYDEDPSVRDNEKTKLSDLVGAEFSFTHNGKAKADTWSSVGALIIPWRHATDAQSWAVPTSFAFAPSVSINRIDTNGDPKDETDSLLARAGAYGDWSLPTTPVSGFQLRAAAVCGTTTGGDGSLWGYEFDLEPRWRATPALGYLHVLIPKSPLKPDHSDTSVLEYQLRGWLHFEGGDIQDNGKSWDATEGSFSRIGPTIQFQVNMPRMLWRHDVSFTGLYSYLAAISGSDSNNTFFQATAAFTLLQDDVLNHKVSLTASFQSGGLNFTKDDVRSFKIGIGILF